jgi:PAS domain S-box-containing protein
MQEPQELELWRYLRSQRELAARLIEGDSLDQVAPRFLEIVADLLHWEAGAVWEVVGDEEPLRLVYGQGTESLGTGLVADARRSGAIALAPAALAIPVPTGSPENVLAVAEFHTTAFNPQSEELMGLLGGFADQLGTFIARRRAEAQSAEAERLRQHLAEVVRGTQDAVLSKDLDGVVTSWNPAATRLYGYSAEEAIGRHISFIVPPDHKNEEMVILDRVKRGERLETYETERIRADDTRIAVSLTVSPILSPTRGLVGASVIARDITAEVRRRRAQEFLVAASRLLDSSLDPTETARTIVSTAVPELAELCLIDFRRADGWLGDSVVAGKDPEMAARLERIRREKPLDPGGEHPVAQVLRLNQPMVWRDLTAPEVVDKIAQNSDHLQLMRDAGYNSAAVVPLVARGRSLGALSFLHAQKDMRYDSGDLEFLAELGERAALALDNARLYRERDRIARNLQRGLRPPRPAEVPGLEVSVVFEAAGEGIEVGGDLYDVLQSEDGCWLLVGDVAGKGSTAAGVSVAVRHSVRGLTREIDEPDEVLRRVNELLAGGDSLNDFASVMLVRLRREGSGWNIALAAAGHPPAVLASADGPLLLGGGSVLGAWAEANVERHERTLAAGETLALCTDGWLEAGPVASHQGPEDFAEMTQALSGLELDEMTERLRADAVGRSSGSLRDDLVVLAVRPA